ncbi:testis-expressed basic protein 1 [Phacochoerus africanus]|uniref:testis-expressed basic protein 1 n=1 Tax=Phacochoerus africanus TaxID=41426 RepID=UPI001FD87470|nr:testis-expressed basic protein 1 [Phacochoerus africanus]
MPQCLSKWMTYVWVLAFASVMVSNALHLLTETPGKEDEPEDISDELGEWFTDTGLHFLRFLPDFKVLFHDILNRCVFVSEIILAIILTLLGFAILAILLTRWTRHKQNEIDVSRYSSEQSAGLLDYEDSRDFSSTRSKRGRGFWHTYSTESEIERMRDLVGVTSNTTTRSIISLGLGFISSDKFKKLICKVQFTAPIPGATGPIKLSQKTIVQTPGPIDAPPSTPKVISPVAAVDSSGKITLCPMVIFPGYMDGELAKKSDPKYQILKSEGTTKFRSSQEENKRAPLDTDNSLPSMQKIESKSKSEDTDLEEGKIEMEVKVEDSDAGIMKKQKSQVNVSVTSMPKEEEAQVEKIEVEIPQGQEAQKEESEAEIPQGQEAQGKKSEVKLPQRQGSQVKKSKTGTPQGQESQVKKSETGTPQGQGSQVKKSETGIPQGQGSQVKKSETGIPQGQGSQVKKSETGIPQGQGSQEKKSETGTPQGQGSQKKKRQTGTPQGQGSQVKKSETGIPQGQGSQVKKSETGIPQGQGSQVKKSETGIPQGQGSQVKKNSKDQEKQDNEKGDVGKNKDTEENDAENKEDDGGENKVKRKNESKIKGKRAESLLRHKSK